MADPMYPPPSREIAQKRGELAPEIQAAFDAFSQRVFADGSLPAKTNPSRTSLLPRIGSNRHAGQRTT